MSERWVVIPRWGDFQHYKDRDPAWIKNYRRLLHDNDYRKLTAPQRATLHGLWLLYAASDGKIDVSTASAQREHSESTTALTQQLGMRVTSATLEALNHAGFITFSDSKPLALRYQAASPEIEIEKEKAIRVVGSDPQPLAAEPRRLLERLRNMSQERKAS